MKIEYIILFLVFLLSGCTLLDTSTAVLWTNRSEIAAYVEFFNSKQDNHRIELVYKESPGSALGNGESVPDIIIGEELLRSSLINSYNPLNNILIDEEPAQDKIPKSLFYTELLDLCMIEENCILLPISFNVPAIMFLKGENIVKSGQFYLTIDEIKELCNDFNKNNPSEYTTLGFSPRWEPEIIFLLSTLNGADFHETSTGYITWNDSVVNSTIEYVDNWINEVNGGIENDIRFADKYLYDPGYKLIINERILFYYSDLKNYFTIPSTIRKDLDFIWFAGEKNIPVFENILYGGIPKGAKNLKAASYFFKWFFKPETQKLLLESAQDKRMRTFGIAEGFSSIPIVNEIEFPRIYPTLVGHIPPENLLEFPDPLPENWNKLKMEVINPWLLTKTSENKGTDTLNEVIVKWIQQN